MKAWQVHIWFPRTVRVDFKILGKGFIEVFWKKKIHSLMGKSDILEGKTQLCFPQKPLKDLKGLERIRTRIASLSVRCFQLQIIGHPTKGCGVNNLDT